MKNNNDLQIFKKKWKDCSSHKRIGNTEIINIIHCRSNSIVKKIFLISFLEFIISIFPFLFNYEQYLTKEIVEIKNYKIIVFLDYFYYALLIYFIITFYINFRKINITSNLNELSKNILKTRKSVYNYVISSLIFFNINAIVFSYLYLESNNSYQSFIKSNHYYTLYAIVFYSIILLILTFISFLIWIIYKKIYLLLIDQLDQNYKELNNNITK